ncbi:hypothetical protein CLOM_g4982 [Closterium sp. NIES-68]|nr:hypothetical protein CLOM_g4982 [Closterium sp. NIES-68]GJP61972.1 hypothetical protein CLOP_g19087 [Closterium sp. NIES-67]
MRPRILLVFLVVCTSNLNAVLVKSHDESSDPLVGRVAQMETALASIQPEEIPNLEISHPQSQPVTWQRSNGGATAAQLTRYLVRSLSLPKSPPALNPTSIGSGRGRPSGASVAAQVVPGGRQRGDVASGKLAAAQGEAAVVAAATAKAAATTAATATAATAVAQGEEEVSAGAAEMEIPESTQELATEILEPITRMLQEDLIRSDMVNIHLNLDAVHAPKLTSLACLGSRCPDFSGRCERNPAVSACWNEGLQDEGFVRPPEPINCPKLMEKSENGNGTGTSGRDGSCTHASDFDWHAWQHFQAFTLRHVYVNSEGLVFNRSTHFHRKGCNSDSDFVYLKGSIPVRHTKRLVNLAYHQATSNFYHALIDWTPQFFVLSSVLHAMPGVPILAAPQQFFVLYLVLRGMQGVPWQHHKSGSATAAYQSRCWECPCRPSHASTSLRTSCSLLMRSLCRYTRLVASPAQPFGGTFAVASFCHKAVSLSSSCSSSSNSRDTTATATSHGSSGIQLLTQIQGMMTWRRLIGWWWWRIGSARRSVCWDVSMSFYKLWRRFFLRLVFVFSMDRCPS